MGNIQPNRKKLVIFQPKIDIWLQISFLAAKFRTQKEMCKQILSEKIKSVVPIAESFEYSVSSNIPSSHLFLQA